MIIFFPFEVAFLFFSFPADFSFSLKSDNLLDYLLVLIVLGWSVTWCSFSICNSKSFILLFRNFS